MKWKAKPEFLKPRYFEIKHDPFVGYYLYVFENDRCVFDHLQDTLEIAIDTTAQKDYDVPANAWELVKED